MSTAKKPSKDDSCHIPDGQSLYARRQKCIRNMYVAINKSAEAGKRRAKLQMDYRIELARKTAKLRDAGTAAALVTVMAKGDPDVAKLEYDMEVATVEEEQYSERINAYKADANLTEALIQREWGKSK